MGNFRRQYPVETSELDSSVEAADGYRELHGRLAGDDLPRFRQQFKTYLNQNTIRDIARFQSQLNQQAELIRERIDTINTSLVGVDYNPGRYIRLEPSRPRTSRSGTSAPTCGPAPTTPCPGRTPTSTQSRSSCR